MTKTRKTFWVEPELWAEFTIIARDNGYSLGGAITNMIKGFIREHGDCK
ncbi:MAG: hypothetical protein JAY75_23020 [Candidatus Thiodiazotropha taylori]|nr:hypothetical protein [Candidatus Thiodiazotropha taylori]MCG8095377.1 hypothetical protein [Candidatus Thiodiazotropha endolucinida]MCG7882931.1 hypothetical protein [Candidatus Thiodiazotropha taylori]MCG7888551.1 hypothetical protein [Candidatus Thiodiazotropha taylori]MCG7892255.1 hypothetical protein [Candidatus Thiodiazotropha taylori]